MREKEFIVAQKKDLLKYIASITQGTMWLWPVYPEKEDEEEIYHAQMAVKYELADSIPDDKRHAIIRNRNDFRAGKCIILRGLLRPNGISLAFPDSFASVKEFDALRNGDILTAKL